MDQSKQQELSDRCSNPLYPISSNYRISRPDLPNRDRLMAAFPESHRVPAPESPLRFFLVPVNSSGKSSLIGSTPSSSTSSPRVSEPQLAINDTWASRRKPS